MYKFLLLFPFFVARLCALGNSAFPNPSEIPVSPNQIEPAVRLLRLPGNLHLEYLEIGDATGQPVVFIHGFTDSRHSYDRLLAGLGSGIHAYVLTLRGHGNSDKPLSGYQPRQLAADVVSFMDELRIDAAFIVGHSMGATVAQCFSVHYPERLKGLVLIGAVATCPSNELLNDLHNEVAELRDPVSRDFAFSFQNSTIAQGVPASWFDTLVNESLKVPAFVWKAALEGMLSSDFTSDLRRMLKPVLLIRGNKDLIATANDQETFLSVLAHAKLLTYTHAGHAPHWEEPARLAQDISDFILQKK